MAFAEMWHAKRDSFFFINFIFIQTNITYNSHHIYICFGALNEKKKKN